MKTSLRTYPDSSPFKTVCHPVKKSTGADARHNQDLRTAAFNELRLSIQSYTDSFVLSMQCQEREERLRKQQRINETREDSRIINELSLILQSKTINDYGPEQNGSDLWL